MMGIRRKRSRRCVSGTVSKAKGKENLRRQRELALTARDKGGRKGDAVKPGCVVLVTDYFLFSKGLLLNEAVS